MKTEHDASQGVSVTTATGLVGLVLALASIGAIVTLAVGQGFGLDYETKLWLFGRLLIAGFCGVIMTLIGVIGLNRR